MYFCILSVHQMRIKCQGASLMNQTWIDHYQPISCLLMLIMRLRLPSPARLSQLRMGSSRGNLLNRWMTQCFLVLYNLTRSNKHRYRCWTWQLDWSICSDIYKLKWINMKVHYKKWVQVPKRTVQLHDYSWITHGSMLYWWYIFGSRSLVTPSGRSILL